MKKGKIVRSAVSEVNRTGRNTQGVTFAKPDKNDQIIAVARNVERNLGDNEDETSEDEVESAASALTPSEAVVATETAEIDAEVDNT